MKKNILFFALSIMILFTGCVSLNIEEFNPEDYGYFNFPKDVKVFKASSDGMIDSTQYYAHSTYNSFTGTTTTDLYKTGRLRMSTKPSIKNDCLKTACKKSTEDGYTYILILDEYENSYESGNEVRYNYQILFMPINKDDISTEMHDYKIFKNTLYYKPMEQIQNEETMS